MTTAQATITPQSARRGPSLAWPLILITVGIVFLLANAGYITGDLWGRLAQIWPIALVLIGVDLLVRPRSVPAALVAEVVLIAAAVVYAIAAPVAFPTVANVNASVARNGASQLDLNLSYGAGALTLTGGATDLVTVLSTRQDVQVSHPLGGATVARRDRPAGERNIPVQLRSSLGRAGPLGPPDGADRQPRCGRLHARSRVRPPDARDGHRRRIEPGAHRSATQG